MTTAPRAPPLETPRMPGAASGLLNRPWRQQPETASPAPTTAAVNARGKRVFSGREDFATVLLDFESGTVANLIASRVSEYKTRTLAISQRDMYVFLDYTDQEIFIHRQASAQFMLQRDRIKYKQDSLIERIFVHKENPLKLFMLIQG